MKILFVIALLISFCSFAKTYDRNYGRDLKLPTQKLIEAQRISAPDAASTAYVINDYAGDVSGAAVSITSGFTDPDVPRVLLVTPVGTTADVKAGNVVIVGTNIKGDAITDTLAFLDNASTATTGTKAFASITSITFPIEDSPYGAQWDVGINDSFGLDKCVAQEGNIAWAVADGTYEGTRPTCTVDADEIEKNVCNPDTSADGSKNFDFYYIQNYACF